MIKFLVMCFLDQAMDRRHFIFSAAVSSALGWSGVSGMAYAQPDAASALYQRSFRTLDGQDTAFSSYLGRPVVVNFWATWCPPCVKEMPDLDTLQQQHPHIAFVGLAVDTLVNVRKFITRIQVTYPLLMAGHEGIDLMKSLGNTRGGLPYTLVLDAQGQIQQQILGPIKPAELNSFLVNMV